MGKQAIKPRHEKIYATLKLSTLIGLKESNDFEHPVRVHYFIGA